MKREELEIFELTDGNTRAYPIEQADPVMDAMEKRIKDCESNHKLWEAENDALRNRVKELDNENAKLKCLALHLFVSYSHQNYKLLSRVRYLVPPSKMVEKSIRNADRWHRIYERCNEAYRKAKEGR